MSKQRVDLLMISRALVESRTSAQRLVMAGKVRVNGEMVLKPSTMVEEDARIEIDQGPPFVSRGGEKLSAALSAFQIDPSGKVCADIGASTGGFTDCLLQHGAKRVYAIDVGKGIFHWKLRQDERVVVLENVNARYLEKLPEEISLATVDVSFISLKIMLPVIRNWFVSLPPNHPQESGGTVIALVKPQFEAGRREVDRGDGVIRDPAVHRRVLGEVLQAAEKLGYTLLGAIRSPLLGPKGNAEFLFWLELLPGAQQDERSSTTQDRIASLFE